MTGHREALECLLAEVDEVDEGDPHLLLTHVRCEGAGVLRIALDRLDPHAEQSIQLVVVGRLQLGNCGSGLVHHLSHGNPPRPIS
jgi:hypothetical protein